MSKAPVAAAIRAITGCSVITSHRAAASVFEEMARVLQEKGVLQIEGFGTFRVAERNSRLGTNPRSGERIELPARKTIRFKPSPQLREKL